MTTLKSNWFKINNSFKLASLLILSNALIGTAPGSFWRVAGATALLLLPGLVWAGVVAPAENHWIRASVGLGLSYLLIVLSGLLLYYLPADISLGPVLLVSNGLALGGLIGRRFRRPAPPSATGGPSTSTRLIVLLLIVGGAALLRFSALGYSEFLSDEFDPLIAAAETLEGSDEALFFERRKGPGEILAPMMLWRLTGTINEFTARLLFAMAGVLSVLLTYLVGGMLLGEKAGLVAAGLTALNGFMVAFSRILQYQQVVIWMSLLALLCAWLWRQRGQGRWLVMMGGFLGVGLLFHYDVIAVLPSLIYLIVSKPKLAAAQLKFLVAAGLAMAGLVALFALPYAANPQAASTVDYLAEERIGLSSLIDNSLYDFFHYTIFYNSFYYVLVTGLLLLGFVGWAASRTYGLNDWSKRRCILPAVAAAAVIYLTVYPHSFHVAALELDLAFLPFALLLLGALFAPAVSPAQRTILIWLAVSFLGYTFAVADPRTHVYTVTPAWTMVSALTVVWLWPHLAGVHRYLPAVCCLLCAALFGGYLYLAFLRQDVEFKTLAPDDYPALYWSPYRRPPQHTFGFVNRVGWKAVGGLYASGRLKGRFATNSQTGAGAWYTRRALWGCDCCQPYEYYLAFDYKEIDPGQFEAYHKIGQLRLPPTGRGVTVYQAGPAGEALEPVELETLYRSFDQGAEPAAFVEPAPETHQVDINLAGFFELIKYDVALPGPQPGGQIALTLYWRRGEKQLPVDFDVFVHLEDAAGNIWGQSNEGPGCGQYPTSTWSPQEIIADSHIVPIKPQTPPGRYRLTVGMYLPADNRRIPVFDETGRPAGNFAVLETVTIDSGRGGDQDD